MYFVTWRLARSQHDLSSQERDEIVTALKHFDGNRYELFGYVVMNDHVHVLVWPEGNQRLQDIIHSWKSFTAHRLAADSGRIGNLWQHESFDRIVRNEQELYEKMQYMLNNPGKRWPELQSYKWVWCKGIE